MFLFKYLIKLNMKSGEVTSDNDNCIYKSKLAIESKMVICFIIIMIIIFPIMTISIANITLGILLFLFFLVPVPFFIFILRQNQTILYNNRIHNKNFKYQNSENETTDIYYNDIKSAKFVKTLNKEQIEFDTVKGKYIISLINFKDFIPELKKQLKDKWKE